jgi:Flp pilus assembly protein TadD
MESNERIGPYRLIEPLGSGGMGTVWRAWDERLKRSVALKQILATGTEDRKLRERLRREAEAGARLNHPAIVHIYDIVETEASDWIVMELVEGRTLQAILREGPLDPQRALRLGREIAEGLAEAHARGYIHRDLKAPNVVVTHAWRAKILDFGVAKQIQPDEQDTTLSAPGTVIGTSYAMSPEQAMGFPLDARSDLFSLGSLLYEMVTGLAPFRAETSTATLARVCSFRQRPASALRPEIPGKLSDLIDRLLEKDPVDRPGSAVKVAAALDQIASAQTPASTTDVSDQETIFELPVHRAPAVLTVAAEPTQPAGSTDLESPLHGARGLRAAIGIAYTLYQQGLACLDRFDRKGNLDLAIDSFQRILAQDKTHTAAHAGLAKAYWLKLQGDSQDPIWLERALPIAERAVALDPYLAAAQVSLGLALESAGRPKEALRHVERALILEPANGDAFYAAGRIYESMRKQQEAEAAYKKAVETHPHSMYLDELGSLYLRMGRTDEAISAFHRSIKLAPDGFKGYRNLGVAYYMQGNLTEAACQFQKALAIQPDASLYANLGTLRDDARYHRLIAELSRNP